MAWDKDKPAASDVLSDSQQDLVDNFTAIETGDSTLLIDVLNLQEQASSPSAITGASAADKAYRLFAKTDAGSGQTELFGLDDGGNEVQFTENGGLGGGATNIVLNQIKFGTNTTTYDAGNIVKARGSFSSAGAVVNASNMSANASPNPSTGVFNVDVDADVLDNATNYQVMAIVTSSSTGNARTVHVVSKATPSTGTATTIQVKITNGSKGLRDESFDIMVTGGV